MSTSNVHKMPDRSSVNVGKAFEDLQSAQARKMETAFDFEQAIRNLVAAENRLYFAKLTNQAKHRD